MNDCLDDVILADPFKSSSSSVRDMKILEDPSERSFPIEERESSRIFCWSGVESSPADNGILSIFEIRTIFDNQ